MIKENILHIKFLFILIKAGIHILQRQIERGSSTLLRLEKKCIRNQGFNLLI